MIGLVSRDLTVPPELDGERLDKAIASLDKALSRARIRRAIDEGHVRVGGRRRPKGATVAAGEVITVAIEDDAHSPAVPTPEAPLVVLLERDDILVVDKPAGMPTAPLRHGETGTLANALVGKYPELAGIGYGPREPGLLHRLDTGTSGVVVVARSAPVFEALRDALKEEKLHKTYLLVCTQDGMPDTGAIDHPLANHPKDQKRVLACVHPRDIMRNRPRPAHTEFRVVERGPKWALVEATAPKALRHQIRAHFTAIDHPLAGDTLYGGEAIEGLDRHALHAASVSYGGSKIVPAFEVRSPLPASLEALVHLGEAAPIQPTQ
jgi:23S rRNA pseudouridine1911/1915/1917 synthase